MALADLVVNLTAETAQFRVAMERAAATSSKSFDKMLGGAKALGAGITAYLTVGALTGFVRAQIDAMDKLDKMSEKVGIAVDDLSKLAYAAQLGDVDINALQTSLIKLSKAATEASKGGGGASEAFKAIGVSITDASGKLKSTDVLFADIAEAFSQYEDGAAKVAIATAIFGKSGADLIPTLNGGRKSLQDMSNELQKLGGVVTPQAAKNSAEFNDNISRMNVLLKGAANNIASNIIPVLNEYMDALLSAQKAQLSFSQSAAMTMVAPFININDAIADTKKAIEGIESGKIKTLDKRLIDVIIGDEKRLRDLKAQLSVYEDIKKRQDKLTKSSLTDAPDPKKQIKFSGEVDKSAADSAKKRAEQVQNLRNELIKLLYTEEQIALARAKELGATPKEIADITALNAAIKEQIIIKENQKKVLELEKQAQENTLQIIESLNEAYLNLTNTTEELALIKAVSNNADYKQIELLLNIIDATKKLKEEQEDQRKAEELAIKNAQELNENLESAREEHNAMRENENELLERYIDLIESTDNSLQKFEKAQQSLLDLREQLIEAGYEQEEVDYRISEALKKQQAEMTAVSDSSKNLQQTYKVLGQTISSAFEDAIMQAKSYKDILNGILTDIARIILRRTLTDPLQQGFENWMSGLKIPGFGPTAGMPTPSINTSNSAGALSNMRANGGMVSANTSYLVGERGKEIFVPSQNGTIIPNGQSMGSNVAVNVNNYSGQKVETKEVKDSRGNRSITVQIGDAVAQEISRSGSNANMALRNTFNTRPNLVGR
jgi:hypothetical protein